MIGVESLDHLVLTVASLERSLDFYGCVLGLEIETFGPGRKALRFGRSRIHLHERGREFEPKAAAPTPGSADLCFLVAVPVAEIVPILARQGVAIELGPVPRDGAAGRLLSIYLRDPDGNLIELANPAA